MSFELLELSLKVANVVHGAFTSVGYFEQSEFVVLGEDIVGSGLDEISFPFSVKFMTFGLVKEASVFCGIGRTAVELISISRPSILILESCLDGRAFAGVKDGSSAWVRPPVWSDNRLCCRIAL